MRVAICGLIKSENLGEEFIAKSLAYIITQEYVAHGGKEQFIIVETDIKAIKDEVYDFYSGSDNRRKNYYGYKPMFVLCPAVYHISGKVARKSTSMVVKNTMYRIQHFVWRHGMNYKHRYLAYFKHKFSGVDCIVIDGAGLLEYSYNEYQEPLNLICEYGDKFHIPVVFNAIGRAGEYDEKDYRCQVLKRIFSHPCVKYVSARDSIETVASCVEGRLEVKLLADAAFCSADAYRMLRNTDSKVIGIGLIRANAMCTYENGKTPEELVELFASIATELMKREYRFQFFTNGFRQDYTTGLRVLEKLGLSEREFLVERPTKGVELMKTISGFSAIITCRMHSSIAAFSMGIPSVILSWNKKVDKYMEIVGYPNRAITQENCHAAFIVDQLEQSLQEGIADAKIKKMKKLAYQSVSEYIDLIIKQEKHRG